MTYSIPRPEYPRPQFARSSWMNLNGSWQFEIDHGASGRARGLVEKELTGKIEVPFCPESELSGVNNKDFMSAVWYRRTFTLPREAEGKRVLLHFGAVDYKCEAWVNGQSVGVHEGGFVSFTFEITGALREGENTLVVCADDLVRSGRQPLGKQSAPYASAGCHYTRTTGIWQTVWLEWVNPVYIKSVRMIPDAANGRVQIDALIDGSFESAEVEAKAFFEDMPQGMDKVDARRRVVGWDEEAEKHAVKIVERELARLRASFEAAKKDGCRKFIMFLHYPPTDILEKDSGFAAMAEEYGAEQVVYAHCHGESRFHDSILGWKNGIKYSLVSGDYLKWTPAKILD